MADDEGERDATTPVHFRCPSGVLADVDARARAQGRTRSNMLVRLLARALEAEPCQTR